MKGNCKYCQKECVNVTQHEKFCKSNPGKVISPLVKARPRPTTEQPPQPATPAAKPLYIRGLVPYSGELVAWFRTEQGYKYLDPVMFGLMADDARAESIPVCLVLMPDGQAVPPFLTVGFIGMFPDNWKFEEPDTTEPPPPFLEETEDKTPLVRILPPQETQPISEPEKPKDAKIEMMVKRIDELHNATSDENIKAQKEGFIDRFVRAIYTKKEKTPTRLNLKTEQLLDRLKNVT